MHDIAKSESSEIRSLAKLYPSIDYDEEIDNRQFDILDLEKKIEKIEKDISKKRNFLKDLNIELATSNNPDIITSTDYENQKQIVSDLDKKIKNVEKSKRDILKKIDTAREKKEKIDLVKSDFSIENLKFKLDIQKDLEKSVLELNYAYEKSKNELKRQKKSVKKLSEVPCGTSFPSCKFIKDSHQDKKTVDDQNKIVKKSLKSLNEIKKSLDRVISEEIEEKILKHDAFAKKQTDLSLAISNLQISLNDILNEEKYISVSINEEIDTLQDMKDRVVYSKDNHSYIAREKISSLESEIKTDDKERLKKFENVAKLRVQIEKIKKDRKDLKKIKKDLRVYDLFIQAVSKTGIPLQIMMSQLPVINAEISKILQGVAGFTVEVEADSDSNSMDIYINYGDSRRIIELASGMEKMMSSLAIRVALINVSSLTKTNMLIIDEGFGALDETNIEACSRLLESLKKWFKNIIIISHVDAIKDAVDNSLEITKNGKDAKVYHG